MEKKKGKHSQREARGNRNMWKKVEGERNNQVKQERKQESFVMEVHPKKTSKEFNESWL